WPDDVKDTWKWAEHLVKNWEEDEKLVYKNITYHRNITIHVGPAEVKTQIEHIPLHQLESRLNPRARDRGLGPIFITGMPGTNKPGTGAVAPVPRISTKSGPFSPGEWLESLPGSARGY